MRVITAHVAADAMTVTGTQMHPGHQERACQNEPEDEQASQRDAGEGEAPEQAERTRSGRPGEVLSPSLHHRLLPSCTRRWRGIVKAR